MELSPLNLAIQALAATAMKGLAVAVWGYVLMSMVDWLKALYE